MRAGSFSLPASPPCRVLVDRVSFCDPFLREAVRAWSLAGTYVLNDPFAGLAANKLSDILWCDRLAIPRPRTVLLSRVNPVEGTAEMADEPRWDEVIAHVGLPCILKPIDGYAWQDVHRVETPLELVSRYEELKDRRTLLAQELVVWTDYYRAFCVGAREVRISAWLPRPLDAGVYSEPDPARLATVGPFIEAKTAGLNAALGLDFNSVEWCIARDGRPVIIDALNDVPDVRREKLPPACYDWIVDRFCACVRDRLAAGRPNRGGAGSVLPQAGPAAG